MQFFSFFSTFRICYLFPCNNYLCLCSIFPILCIVLSLSLSAYLVRHLKHKNKKYSCALCIAIVLLLIGGHWYIFFEYTVSCFVAQDFCIRIESDCDVFPIFFIRLLALSVKSKIVRPIPVSMQLNCKKGNSFSLFVIIVLNLNIKF